MKLSIFRKIADRGYLPHNVSSDGNDAAEEAEARADGTAIALLGHTPAPDHSLLPLQLQRLPQSALLSLRSGKKYQPMNHRPGSPCKTTTIENRTISTCTVNTQSLTSSSPDSASRWSKGLSNVSYFEGSLVVSNIDDEPTSILFEEECIGLDSVQDTFPKDLPSIFRMTSDNHSGDVYSNIVLKNIQDHRAESTPTSIQQGLEVLDDCIVEEEEEEQQQGEGEQQQQEECSSSFNQEEELDISLFPTLVIVHSDLTDKSFDLVDSIVELSLMEQIPPQGLDKLWLNVFTQMSTCFGHENHHDAVVSDEASSKLSILNSWAICGRKKTQV